MVRKYVSCAVFSVAVLLVGVLLSLPMSIEVNSIGEKPLVLFYSGIYESFARLQPFLVLVFSL